MAIEKLTGPRLYQLIFLLVVLISAFTWRTITYVPTSDISQISDNVESCDITNEACILNIDNNQIIIDVQERPIKQNVEIIVSVIGIDSKWEMNANGVNMNMGTLKFNHLDPKDNIQLYSVFVPKCKHNEMKWKIDLSLEDKVISVIFNSKK